MSYARWRQAILLDSPTDFYPFAVTHPGGAASFDTNHAPRRAHADLEPANGTPATGALVPRVPFLGARDPFVSPGSTTRATNTTATLPVDVTIEAWVFLVATHTSSADVYPVTLATSGNPVGAGLRYYNFNWEAMIGDTAGGLHDVSRIPVTLGRWVHLCMSYNDTTRELAFALNGVTSGIQAAGGGGTKDSGAKSVFLGRYNSSFTLYWPAGSGIFGVAIFDRFDKTMAARHYRAAMAGPVRRGRAA